MKSKLLLSIVFVIICASAVGQAKADKSKGPDLSGGWPTTTTLDVLKEAGLIHEGDVDTSATKTTRFTSERLSKYLWHQLYFVRLKLRSGDTVLAIADVDYSPIADMNMGPVVYVVSRVLQPEGKPEPTKR